MRTESQLIEFIIDECKEMYGSNWDKLTKREQEIIISDTLKDHARNCNL
jgi:hypothetical protein